MLRILVLTFVAVASADVTSVLFHWDNLEYAFKNETPKARYNYIPKNNHPVGMSVWKDKMFITVPRWREGVVATLNVISISDAKKNNDKSPKLEPYPNWESHDLTKAYNPNTIISVMHARPDACDRLWTIDLGQKNLFNTTRVGNVFKPPRVLIFDLNTNKMIRQFNLTSVKKQNDSFFSDFTIEVSKENCKDAYLYVSDTVGNSIVVYSYAQNQAWYFPELFMKYDNKNEHFLGSNGVHSLILSSPSESSPAKLYFYAVPSTHVYSVPTSVLKNKKHKNLTESDVTHEGDKGQGTQALTARLAKDGFFYFPLINQRTLACWKRSATFESRVLRHLVQNDENYSFIPDMMIDENKDEVYILNSEFRKFVNEPNKPLKKIVHKAKFSQFSSKCTNKNLVSK